MNITLKIHFDTKYWEELLDNIDWFWSKFIAPELLANKLKLNMAKVVYEKYLVAVPYITSNDGDGDADDDSPQQTTRKICISLPHILNPNQLDMCFQSEEEL